MCLIAKEKDGSKGKSKGQAMVEVTLIFPLLVILVGAAVDWGMAFFVSHLAQNAAREGARAAATKLDPPVAGTVSCVYDVDCSSASNPGLKAATSSIPTAALFDGFTITNEGVTGTCPDQEVRVTVSGSFNFIFLRLLNTFIGFFPPSVNISRTSQLRWERQVCAAL